MPQSTSTDSEDPDLECVTRTEHLEVIDAIMQTREQVDALRAELDQLCDASGNLVRVMRKTCDAFAAAIDDYEQVISPKKPVGGPGA